MNRIPVQATRFGGTLTFALLVGFGICPALGRDQLHQLRAPETLEDVALRYLGDRAAAGELRRFNGLDAADPVEPGMILAIPGDERQRAREQMVRADQLLDAARLAQANRYAPTVFASAERSAASSQAALANAAYSQSAAQADVAAWYAEESIRLADERARREQPGVLRYGVGELTQTTSQGVDWIPIEPGSPVPMRTWLRAGSDSRGILELPDGSQWRLEPDTIAGLRRYVLDERTEHIEYSLGLSRGGLIGRIPDGASRDIRTVLVQDRVLTLSANAWIRIDVMSEDQIMVAVYAGQVRSDANGRRDTVTAGQGAIFGAQESPQMESLLPAPSLEAVGGTDAVTARQIVTLAWTSDGSSDPRSYQIQVSQDERFLALVHERWVDREQVDTPVLSEGEYGWRVVPWSDGGLPGYPSEPSAFRVEKFMDIEWGHEGPLLRWDDQWVGGAATRFSARSARNDHSLVGFEVQIDGSPFRRAGSDVQFQESGEYRMTLRGVAADSTTGPELTRTVLIDADPPTVSVDVSPAFTVPGAGRMVEAEVLAEDRYGIDEIMIGVDRAAMTRYEGPLQLPADRDVRLRFTARDRLMNSSPLMTLRIQGEAVPR